MSSSYACDIAQVYPNLIATTLIDKLAVRCRFGKKGCPDPKEWLQEDEEGCNAVINVGCVPLSCRVLLEACLSVYDVRVP